MSTRAKVNLAKYGGCAVFTALLIWAYMGPRDFAAETLQNQYRMLCDAFTVPGLMMILAGALVWVSNEGALNGIAYCLRLAVFALIPGKRKDAYEKYGDYVERKKQKQVKGYAFLFWSGLTVMAVAMVFFVLYYLQ